MKSNTLLMMYAADILDGTKKIYDVPQMLQADVLNLATRYTSQVDSSSADNGAPRTDPVPLAVKEGPNDEK